MPSGSDGFMQACTPERDVPARVPIPSPTLLMPEASPPFSRAFLSLVVALHVGVIVGLAEERSDAPPVSEVSSAEATQADFPRAEAIFPQLEPILQRALSQSPRMMQQNLALVAAAYDRYVEKTVLYPRIAGYGQFNVQNEQRVNESADGSSSDGSETVAKTYYDFSLSQPLYHWGALKAQADIGRIRYQLAERNYRDVFQGLANEIRDSYLRLVVGRIAQRNRRIELEQANIDLERARQRVDEGREIAGTTAALQAAIDSMTLAGDRSDVALDRALQVFKQLTGESDLTLEDIPEAIPAPTPVERARSLPLREEYVSQREFEDHPRYFNS